MEDVATLIADAKATLDTVRAERDALRAVLKAADLSQLLEDVREYMDDRADADCDSDGFIPNAEMKIAQAVQIAQAALAKVEK